MTSLTVIISAEGIELVIDTITGEAFATQAGYAKMSGLEYDTVKELTQRFIDSTGTKKVLESSEIVTAKGNRTTTLLPADIVFEWLIRDNLDLALQMGKVGATLYLCYLAGYKIDNPLVKIERPKVPMLRHSEFLELKTEYIFAQQEHEWAIRNNYTTLAGLWLDAMTDFISSF